MALVTAALLVGTGTRQAQACSSGSNGFGAAVGLLAASATDLVFTVGDVVWADGPRPATMGWGIMEAAVTAPQAALFGWWSYTSLRDGQDGLLPIAMTLWSSALAVHGFYTIVSNLSDAPPREPPRRAAVDWKVAPAMVAAGPSPAAPGAVIFGRF
jgi:hypothetical protein